MQNMLLVITEEGGEGEDLNSHSMSCLPGAKHVKTQHKNGTTYNYFNLSFPITIISSVQFFWLKNDDFVTNIQNSRTKETYFDI